jgi:hypothetical protein
MKLVEVLKTLAPKLEGNMKVTKTDYSSYEVKCYGEGDISEINFDIFYLKVSNGVEEDDLHSKEILEFFCDGSVDPTGVEDLEIGHSMIFELF